MFAEFVGVVSVLICLLPVSYAFEFGHPWIATISLLLIGLSALLGVRAWKAMMSAGDGFWPASVVGGFAAAFVYSATIWTLGEVWGDAFGFTTVADAIAKSHPFELQAWFGARCWVGLGLFGSLIEDSNQDPVITLVRLRQMVGAPSP